MDEIEQAFVEAMDSAINVALADGAGYDTIISALELKLMALKEEEQANVE